MKYEVWYLKPEALRTTLQGPNALEPRRLKRTHAYLKTVEIEFEDGDPLEAVLFKMQEEIWSPNGEAKNLIQSLKLDHTSMSVDDIIVDEQGRVFIVEAMGFRELAV